jgi:hypothetical protein
VKTTDSREESARMAEHLLKSIGTENREPVNRP